MRNQSLERRRCALNWPASKLRSFKPIGRAICGRALLGMVAMLGLGAALPAPVAAETPLVQVAFADIDPGPPPRREDFKSDVDYWLAYLSWLYVVNGGDPSKLRNAGIAEAATTVAAHYAAVGWRVDESKHSRTEILAATNEMLAFAQINQSGVSPLERMLMKGAALAIQASVPLAQ